jgi:hypothetical protein
VESPDVLRILFAQPVEIPEGLDGLHLVRPDGTIELGDAGSLRVAGKSLDQIKSDLAALLKSHAKTDMSLSKLRKNLHVELAAKTKKKTDSPAPVRLERSYTIECNLIQADPDGAYSVGDIKGSILSRPKLKIIEGADGDVFAGSEVGIPGLDKQVHHLRVGVSIRVSVHRLNDGLLLKTEFEHSTLSRSDELGVVCNVRKFSALHQTKLGETVKITLMNDNGMEAYWGLIRVADEEVAGRPIRVGQIFIVGNERTESEIILKQVPLYPGQVLSYPDLQAAEKNLAKLGIFQVDLKKGVRPTVTVVDPDGPGEFKDIIVNVKEK